MLRLPDPVDRQRLLDIAVDHGIRHLDVARLYGLGLAEGELSCLLRRHPGALSVATKFGLGEAGPPSGAAQRQGGLRRLLILVPALRSLAKQIHRSHLLARNFSTDHCRQSLHTSLSQLGLEAVDLFLLHEPSPADLIPAELGDTLQELQRQGLIGSYGLSGDWSDCLNLLATRPCLAGGWLQWEDDLLNPAPPFAPLHSGQPARYGRFGRIRCSLHTIRQYLAAVPQLQRHWSERLNCSLAEDVVLGAALLGASMASDPEALLLYSTTDPVRLARTLALLNDPPWNASEAIAFEAFWRPPAAISFSP
ncbi:aldo/keto reductase [Synechococcus sp. CS-1327]|nr:aldo/keto reductase [Synechococcus sp. CS-1327]